MFDNILCSKPVIFIISFLLFIIAQILLSYSLGTMIEMFPSKLGKICENGKDRNKNRLVYNLIRSNQ